jgi:hypothetical protein
MQETVDQHIMKKLNLPEFKKWKQKFVRLRQAQREPTHWSIDRSDPVAAVLPRIEPGDRTLVIGAGAERAAYLLAAHDTQVTCFFGDNATALAVEGRFSSESLSPEGVFVGLLGGSWFPSLDGPAHLVVMDVGTLAALSSERQRALIIKTQQVTAPEGVHALVTNDDDLAPEGFLSLYSGWQRLPLPAAKRSRKRTGGLAGLLLGCPPIPPSALASVP